MPGSNTCFTPQGTGGGLPSAGIGNATAETIFSAGSPGNSANSLILQVPANGELSNKRFRINVAGRVVPGTTGNFTYALYAGTTITSGNKMATSAATSYTVNTNGSFWLVYEGYWDSSSKQIMGTFWGNQNNTILDITAASNVISQDPNPSLATTQKFIVTGLFGSTNASNNAFVDVFEWEVL